MAIFNSYVKLPEGKFLDCFVGSGQPINLGIDGKQKWQLPWEIYGKSLGFIESRLLDHSCICQWGDFYLIWARHWNELHLHPPAGVHNTGTSLFLAGSPNIYGKWTHYHRPFRFQQGFEEPIWWSFWSLGEKINGPSGARIADGGSVLLWFFLSQQIY